MTGLARQTPSGARPNKGAERTGSTRQMRFSRGVSFGQPLTDRPDPLRLPGRSLEAPGNWRPRKMIIRGLGPGAKASGPRLDRIRLTMPATTFLTRPTPTRAFV